MMFETTPDRRHRDAIRNAHEARGRMIAESLGWLFSRKGR